MLLFLYVNLPSHLGAMQRFMRLRRAKSDCTVLSHGRSFVHRYPVAEPLQAYDAYMLT